MKLLRIAAILEGLRLETLLKKRLCHKCFPMNFAKLLVTPIFKNICERILLVAG